MKTLGTLVLILTASWSLLYNLITLTTMFRYVYSESGLLSRQSLPQYFMKIQSISKRSLSKEAEISIKNKFHININTIIRTQDSRSLGAKYLNETDVSSNEECLIWCWETSKCNVAVFEEKSRGSCYLFNCGSPTDFQCKFTSHNFYTSSILRTTQHSYDLSEWGSQVKHENELAKLQSGTVSAPEPSVSSAVSVSKPPASPSAVGDNVLKQKPGPKCRHYQFQCWNSSECIAIYNVCDGIPQCPDGSDESVDFHCPPKEEQSLNPSPTAFKLQPPTPSSHDQQASLSIPPSQNKMQQPIIESELPQKPMTLHTASNRYELQKQKIGIVLPAENEGSRGMEKETYHEGNVPWNEGYSGNQGGNQADYGSHVVEGADTHSSPFNHKHSKFVAATNPRFQYNSKWTDDYDQYPHQPTHQEQQYNPYENNYQRIGEHNLNSQITSDFDGGVYENYQQEQNPYWLGQDHVQSGSYQNNGGTDLSQQNIHGPSRQLNLPDQSDMYIPHQWPIKQKPPEQYLQPDTPINKPQHLQLMPPQDQVALQDQFQSQRQNVQRPKLTMPYHDLSQPNYPYSESRSHLPHLPAQQEADEDAYRSKGLSNNNLDQQQTIAEKPMHLYEPIVEVPLHTVPPLTGNHGKEVTLTAQDKKVEGASNGHSTNINQTNIAKSNTLRSNQSPLPYVGNLKQDKMTSSELYESSVMHAHESNSAVLALTLGMCITALLLVLVGCRMRAIHRRIARKGRTLAHDADYLVNGMYL